MYLTHCLHRALQQTPDQIATIFRGRKRTWREFSDRVARLAHGLQKAGMAPGDRVGMLALNSDRYCEYMMAVWWGGGVLNPVNIRWSVPEIVYSLNDCDTHILIVDDNFAHLADGICETAAHAPTLIHAGDGDAPAGMLSYERLIAEHAPVEDARRGYEDLAAIMYTGGTTGFPKGVMQSHRALWTGSVHRLADIPALAGTRVLISAPLFHIASMAGSLMRFIRGEVQVIIPAFNAAEVLETIERERITEASLVPVMIQAMIAHPDFAHRDLRSLKRLSYGASPMTAAVLEKTLAMLPGVEFTHSYGLTEAMILSSNPPENHGEAARKTGLHASAGRPVLGVELRIVDSEDHEVPRGTVGEIVVRGPTVMQAYWNKPEESARAMRNDWFHTGDGGYMNDEGYIFIVDRMKDMIVSGGENVYSAEVENTISRHPQVAICAVIGVPHEIWGEAVHAIVVLKAGATVTEDGIRAHCREFIAGYKCPKTVEFRTELPMSAAGKILKRDLRVPYWEGKKRSVN
ncbi:acyl-CoA synthetase [Paraburkholderia azotifigens]|uniref:Long-chain fatty acid--CoA ligase n=1 Tax=Paraburkholderia azotifigens TaxID=2057004 RepID=A0A5C6VAV0_9BURK|nr:long-chain fatty acid--CoA ligase [Paraburkholderia azotifigens]TXC82329.1 long-chain fatty acid--CoA ligase [Paraburkholderia azotifigens]